MRSLTSSLGPQLMVDIIPLVPQQELDLASVSNGERREGERKEEGSEKRE